MIYSSITKSKNGEDIPLFLDGKPMHSKYNPSAERLLADASVTEGFFLIGGIGGGYHIENLTKQLENYFIIAFEADKESLDFCLSLEKVKVLSSNPRIILCQAEEVPGLVAGRYLPALYGDFSCLFQRAWQTKNEDLCSGLGERLKDTLKTVSADFSVQSHFGKIWMHNILVNLRDFTPGPDPLPGNEEREKCAAIIAAGPTLDESMSTLREKRRDFFVIATDTTTGPLYRNGINPDAIVCVDAQSISSEHFYPIPAADQGSKSPLVFLDICSAPSTMRMLRSRGIQPVFFHSGHPLASLAAEECGMMQVETGSGTVTIAAADIARQLGFTRLRLFGADFAYSHGKPYAKGTYLDARFGSWSTALLPAEQQFAALMYRTPLREIRPGVLTGDVLEGYGKSLAVWQEKHGYEKKRDELRQQNAEKRRGSFVSPFDFKGFMKKCLCDMGQLDDVSKLSASKSFYALLPYVAYLRQHSADIGAGKNCGVLGLLKAAADFAGNLVD